MCWWIKLHRKIVEWERYWDTNMFRVFIHLLLKANYKDKKRQWVDIKRWQLVTWRIILSEELWLSEQQIRLCLTKLKTTNEIAIKTTNKFSIVTLLKYNDYQSLDNEEQPTEQPTNEPTDNQQTTTTKESKEVKEEKKITKKRFEVVADYDDFCTRLDWKDYSIEYPSKNIEIEKKKCWAFFDSKWKEIKDARKTFTNRLLPKARENEYIEWIKRMAIMKN
jgi:hypothetical protein